MNLFQLSAQYQRLMERINEIDNIDECLIKEIECINDSLENKVLNYTAIIKSIESKAKAIQDAVDSMEKRIKSLSSSADYLRETIKNEMKNCHKDRIENEYHAVKLIYNNPRVNYVDKTIIPPQFLRRKITEVIEPNTSLISKALKENVEVPGAYLVKDQRLEIR